MNCTTFQNQFGEIRTRSHELSEMLDRYLANPALYPDLPSQFQRFEESRRQFIEDYQSKAFELLKTYFERNENSLYMDLGKVFLPIEDNGLQFDENGRVTVNRNVMMDDETYFPSLIRKITGGLDITGSPIDSLDFLEEVGGALQASKPENSKLPPLSSAKRLRRIGQTGYFMRTNLTSLDSLEEVGIKLDIRDSRRLRSMKNLKHVEHGISGLEDTKIEQFESLESLGAILDSCIRRRTLFPKVIETNSLGFNHMDDWGFFRDNFPNLKRIRKNVIGASAYVDNERAKAKLEADLKKWNIPYEGNIRIVHVP